MALKFQYNKTALQNLRRQLSIREKALPTLKSKEAALRLEVRKITAEIELLKEEYQKLVKENQNYNGFWTEFPEIVKIKKINSDLKNIAGVKVNILSNIDFAIENVSLFNMPSWIRLAISMFERLMTIQVKIEMTEERLNALAYARKKTTQKVNLYEKVQIPEYKTAIIKIKRYMEDEDNLSKSSQKIVKERNRAKEASL
ncbi:V-type ATP synthase subunit D [Brachyspira hyodysenteriae]|uniref:V-type ATP synthase subunit D n=2 Tax=Brachyspira hyodysenteriae TaxID=159 RepID=A0A3B6VAD4_BRAHW|nr:V-type ATP synthase subunit D [Brachyspira hyodysenteriae]ACN84379.1 V-type ATP synthase subunit D [Brachyspira hyodysenteriae WA1]ANN63537.1 V-type ATP synthase subunit D [Brachyspira hyodysenteriae ATCC 27164]AUJ50109.1 ATP synthase subunit D [Brachyspira hyodysenteriae]KLI18788.1 ATP synthase subunit D [Brachyspira hyodysenteriae]KLI18891.1 ATP synthase subunit D [Brachyspira hyodysenteriae]